MANIVPYGKDDTTGLPGYVKDGDVVVDETGAVVADSNPDVVGQAEAEAGVATTERLWTAERVGQAIAALETSIGDVGKVLQRLFVEINGSSPVSHSVEFPNDGTIPQGNEGYLTLSLSITPLSTTSKIVAKSGIWGDAGSSATNHVQAAMGRGTGNMDVATESRQSNNSAVGLMTLCSEYASGSTSTQDWRVITGFRGTATASFPPTIFGAAGICWMELLEIEG
jgi:hypothetical protein